MFKVIIESGDPMYARILMDIKHEDVNRFFDYAVPSTFEQDIKKGMRVVVPFGHQTRMGYVIKLLHESEEATKDIIALLDIIPTIQDETFYVIDYILEETNELYSAVFETVVPREIGLNYYQDIRLIKPKSIDKEFLALFSKNGLLRLSKRHHTYDHLIRKYLKDGAVSVTPSWQQKAKEKAYFVYRLNPSHHYHRINAYPAFDQWEDKGYLKSELNALGLTNGHIQTLLKHDVLKRKKEKIEREISHVYALNKKDITLTDKQKDVYKSFYAHQDKQTFLLKGVTGSGKTEIYLKWIQDVLDHHKQVMVLVPEIALIAPMAERLESTFGDIAIYHSHLSKGERFDQYMNIKQGKVSIVLGTRSSVFLPLDQLGLIIVDEAHDSSYQQVDRTSYDARHIAEIRARYHQAKLVLGSATPAIEDMYKAKQGIYQLLELNERPFGLQQPSLTLVDMRDELKQKNTSMFSKQLFEAIKKRLNKKEQIMILFNRKGYAPFVMCRQCGYVPTCPTCGIALTYYQTRDKLSCHYCGYEEDFKQNCDKCHHQTMKVVGVGIEQVEQELKRTFPTATILRMDANQTKTKHAHEIIWHDFQHQKADILLGTQMIAKGLDFPHVTLVGVLMADMMLHTPSFRASEDAFMLLTQVAGRSGRSKPGEVIIQGYDLDHYAIKDVLRGYDTFYEEAIYERQISGYEPFMHVYQIIAEGKGYLHTYQTAYMLKKHITKQDEFILLGPVPAYIKKKGDKFRFVMTIKTSQHSKESIFKAMKTVKTDNVRLRFYPIPHQG